MLLDISDTARQGNGEKGPVRRTRLPDVNLNIYETIIVYDHVLHEVTLLHTEIERGYEGRKFRRVRRA